MALLLFSFLLLETVISAPEVNDKPVRCPIPLLPAFLLRSIEKNQRVHPSPLMGRALPRGARSVFRGFTLGLFIECPPQFEVAIPQPPSSSSSSLVSFPVPFVS